MAVRDYQFITGPETSTLPTATDPVSDSDTINLGYANKTYTRGIDTVATLKALSSTQRTDNQTVWLDSLKAFFYFDSGSSETGNDVSVITPTAGTGRWIRVKQPKTDVATTATINALASNTQLIKFTGATATQVNGVSYGTDGYRVLVVNASSANVTIANQNGSASAADRIITQNGADLTLTPNKSVELAYDSADSRWRVVGGGSGGSDADVKSKTANYTVTAADEVILCDASGGGFTISLLTAVGSKGKRFTIKKIDSSVNTVVIDPNSSETIEFKSQASLTQKGQFISIVSDDVNWLEV